MKEPDNIVVPYHKGIYKGEDVICLHTDFNTVLRLFEDRMEMGDDCLIPEVPLIPRSAFPTIDEETK